MKSIIIFIFIFCCLEVYSQSSSSSNYTEYKKTENNTYSVRNYANRITIANTIDPFKGLRNKEEWQSRYNITKVQGNIQPLLVTHIGPYLKDMQIGENDSFHVFFTYSLSGRLLSVEFCYPSNFNIPIKAIEGLETVLKTSMILTVEPVSTKHLDGVYYIDMVFSFSLKEIKTDAFPPTPPPTPAWKTESESGEDLAILLLSFAPKFNYEKFQ